MTVKTVAPHGYCYLKKTMLRRWNDPGIQMTSTMKMHLISCHLPKLPIAPKICSLASWMASISTSSDSRLTSLRLTLFVEAVVRPLEASSAILSFFFVRKRQKTKQKMFQKIEIMPHTIREWMSIWRQFLTLTNKIKDVTLPGLFHERHFTA